MDERLSLETRRTAEHAAEAVASRLTTEDLERPIGPIRTETISSFVDRRLLDPSESVTIWSTDGVVVYAADPNLIGTQDRRLRDRFSRVLSSGTQTETTDGSVRTFVAVVVGEGDGTPLVAESSARTRHSSDGQPWIYASIAAAASSPLSRWRRHPHVEPWTAISSGSAASTTCAGSARTCLQAQGRLGGRGRRRRTCERARARGRRARQTRSARGQERPPPVRSTRGSLRRGTGGAGRGRAQARVTVREEVARLIETELKTRAVGCWRS